MQLLVTRPQPQADDWVHTLREHGVPAHALPLITIVAEPADVAASAWSTLATCTMAMFVSPNAVAHFFAQRPPSMPWPPQVWAGSTGPGTSAALRDAGVPAVAIVEPPPAAAQFDSESLWSQLADRPWAGQRVLVVRGDGGRDWLAERLRAEQAVVDFVSVYRRTVPQLDAEQNVRLQTALAEPARTWWLFSSSQAVSHLLQLTPQATWAHAQAWATHPRIAQTLQAQGFGHVHPVAPPLDAVVAAWVRSLQSAAVSDQRP